MANNCKICKIKVTQKEIAVCCDFCKQWIHITCGKISKSDYERFKLIDVDFFWFCEEDRLRINAFIELDHEIKI